MSTNDILDVLNIQRDNTPPAKKQKTESQPQPRQTGMARELYNLLGPNTPPVAVNPTQVKDWKVKATPWSRQGFVAKEGGATFYHWVRGAKELIEQNKQTYFFKKFNTNVDIPSLVDKETYEKFMEDIKEEEIQARKSQRKKDKQLAREKKKKELRLKNGEDKQLVKKDEGKHDDKKQKFTEDDHEDDDMQDDNDEQDDDDDSEDSDDDQDIDEKESSQSSWTYEETEYLFELCKAFELKWHIIFDRYKFERSQEELKEHFYRICTYIYSNNSSGNPQLIESLSKYNKFKEIERKQYLERLLKRTPAEIAEEESLVIEARRFELAAKKMLQERSNLLTLLDYPQASHSVLQYQSSQGIANLYNNLMIMDKNQKRRQLQQNAHNDPPIPPAIPISASSSIRKERNFQTHLQQYLAGLLKQNQQAGNKSDGLTIQKLLMKRMTVKDEEAFGLYYHANEKLTSGVVLRSSQRLPGLQQRQSVLKSASGVLEELDIATADGTSWKPVMPTRKTMAKYDELLRAVVTLLDVKRGSDKLESEIKLIRSQKGLD